MNKFYKSINKDKIEINWNKNPIKMNFFLSFLIVDVERSKEHLGSYNGWTLLKGENGLEIGGGKVRDIEYLNSIRYGKNLDNSYNNFVNPFYLFDIFNEEGKRFFIEYYASEINAILNKTKAESDVAQQKAKTAKEKEKEATEFWNNIQLQSKI
jgi:hypothetical protein